MDTDEDLPTEWLLELGKITNAWPTFENFLNLMIQKLAGFENMFDPTYTIMVAHASMPQRLDMLSSLCDRKVEEFPHLGEYKKVVGLIKEAQTARNRFTHNPIGRDIYDSEKFNLMIVSARGKLKQELQPVRLTDLEEATNKIKTASKAIYQLVLQPNP
jgi:hypothetical protein